MNTKRFDIVTAAFTVICAGCLAVYAYYMLTVPEPPPVSFPWQTSPGEYFGDAPISGGWAVVRHPNELHP